MKGRFSRIFELFNQRNTEYYQQAFDRLEKENKTTFNFAAAFYPTTWLVFRKMYNWAIIFILVCIGIQISLGALYPGPKATIIIFMILSLITFIGFGFWGNSLYYREVKSRVSKGYNSMEGYNSIDPVWGIIVIGVVVPLLIGIGSVILISKNIVSKNVVDLIFVLVRVSFVAIPWAINYKKFHSQESAESAEVTKESVNVYLEKANPKRLTVSMGTMIVTYLISFLLILSMVSVLAVVGMKATGEKVKSQLGKIAEEVDKMPNKKAKKGIKILGDNETRKQLDEIDELNKRIIEKQKLGKTSKTDESMRKDLDALHDAWAKLAKDVKKKKNSSKVPAKTAELEDKQKESIKIKEEFAD